MDGRQGMIATIISYVVLTIIGLFFIGLDIGNFTWFIMVACALFWLAVMKIQELLQKRKDNLCKKVTHYCKNRK